MKTFSYSIPNVTCKHCVKTISTALETLPGVEYVEVDESTKILTVEGSNELSDESIRQKLIEIGYPAD